MSNLAFLFEGAGEPTRPDGWSDEHISGQHKWWSKLTKQQAIYDYNVKYHTPLLAARPQGELKFIAALDIPHLSQWAKKLING